MARMIDHEKDFVSRRATPHSVHARNRRTVRFQRQWLRTRIHFLFFWTLEYSHILTIGGNSLVFIFLGHRGNVMRMQQMDVSSVVLSNILRRLFNIDLTQFIFVSTKLCRQRCGRKEFLSAYCVAMSSSHASMSRSLSIFAVNFIQKFYSILSTVGLGSF